MKFMYVGDEAETTIFGHTFKRGEEVEVTDAHAIKKLKNSVLFMHNEETPAGPQGPTGTPDDLGASIEPKRRGRQPRTPDAPQ